MLFDGNHFLGQRNELVGLFSAAPSFEAVADPGIHFIRDVNKIIK
jgi:hypothetical protein